MALRGKLMKFMLTAATVGATVMMAAPAFAGGCGGGGCAIYGGAKTDAFGRMPTAQRFTCAGFTYREVK